MAPGWSGVSRISIYIYSRPSKTGLPSRPPHPRQRLLVELGVRCGSAAPFPSPLDPARGRIFATTRRSPTTLSNHRNLSSLSVRALSLGAPATPVKRSAGSHSTRWPSAGTPAPGFHSELPETGCSDMPGIGRLPVLADSSFGAARIKSRVGCGAISRPQWSASAWRAVASWLSGRQPLASICRTHVAAHEMLGQRSDVPCAIDLGGNIGAQRSVPALMADGSPSGAVSSARLKASRTNSWTHRKLIVGSALAKSLSALMRPNH